LRLPCSERPKAKNVSASGGFAPLTLDQRLCPWTPLGAPPQTPRYRLMHSARHGAGPPKKFQARTATALRWWSGRHRDDAS